jgi:hypothetical protein
MGFAALATSTIIITLVPKTADIGFHELPVVALPGFLLVLSLLTLMISLYGIKRFQEITNALDRYDEYKNQFIAKWGEPEHKSE